MFLSRSAAPFIASCVLALSVCAFAQAPTSTVATDATSSTDVERMDWTVHVSLGLGVQSTRMRMKNGDRMAFTGPSVVGEVFAGRRVGLLYRFAVSVPLDGRQRVGSDVSHVDLDIYDERRIAFDHSLLVAGRIPIGESLVWTGGFGFHAERAHLRGGLYVPVETHTVGLAYLTRLEWRVHPRWTLGAELASGVDFSDRIAHANSVRFTFPVGAALSVGTTFGGWFPR